jgi:Rhodopirellula transposase DDE domain
MAAEQEVYHQLLRSAARRLTGYARRLFIAEVTDTLCGGSPRRSERLFGWSRDTAALGIQESAHGLRCVENFPARGRQRTEDRDTQLAQDIRALAEPHTQADPQLKSTLRYTRLTAVALRRALIKEKGYRSKELPSNRTLQRMLNRMGYRLKRIQKTKPVKKIKQTDAIFANIQQRHEEASQDAETLEISLDTKAKVNLGEYSRKGATRSNAEGQTRPAWDHDPQAQKRGFRSGS